jgi:hypothetical protein
MKGLPPMIEGRIVLLVGSGRRCHLQRGTGGSGLRYRGGCFRVTAYRVRRRCELRFPRHGLNRLASRRQRGSDAVGSGRTYTIFLLCDEGKDLLLYAIGLFLENISEESEAVYEHRRSKRILSLEQYAVPCKHRRGDYLPGCCSRVLVPPARLFEAGHTRVRACRDSDNLQSHAALAVYCP